MSGNSRESHLDVREWSEAFSDILEVVGRPSRMSGSGWETLMDVRDRSGDPPGCPGVVGVPGCPGVVGRLSRMPGSGLVALPDVREWSGGLQGCPGEVGRTS